MNIANIKYNDIANGLGIRTTIFVSGCTNHCKGCFQPETWDFDYGEPFSEEIRDKILDSIKKDTCDGLTVLGGEPFEPSNQKDLLPFLKTVKTDCPEKTIWMYTGFLYDSLLPGGIHHVKDITDQILSLADILVDGPFIEARKNIMLPFRGSENQRIIDLKKSTLSGSVVLLNA